MSNFCYNCGAKTHTDKFCPRCGADLNPPEDVYCNAQTCDDFDCGADVPRWSRFCPVCGKSIRQYDPNDMNTRAERHKGLITGALFCTLIVFMIAGILPLVDEEIPFKVTGIVAAVLSALAWINVLRKWERGKTVDGAVTRHWTEQASESVVVPDEKTLLNHRQFEQRSITCYKTEIRWDDGKTSVSSMDNCAADHIQLAPGDRVRRFISTGEFVKLQ